MSRFRRVFVALMLQGFLPGGCVRAQNAARPSVEQTLARMAEASVLKYRMIIRSARR